MNEFPVALPNFIIYQQKVPSVRTVKYASSVKETKRCHLIKMNRSAMEQERDQMMFRLYFGLV